MHDVELLQSSAAYWQSQVFRLHDSDEEQLVAFRTNLVLDGIKRCDRITRKGKRIELEKLLAVRMTGQQPLVGRFAYEEVKIEGHRRIGTSESVHKVVTKEVS